MNFRSASLVIIMSLILASAPIADALATDKAKLKLAPASTAELTEYFKRQKAQRKVTPDSDTGIDASVYASNAILSALAAKQDGQLQPAPFVRTRKTNQIQVDLKFEFLSESTVEQLKRLGLDIEVANFQLKRVQAWATSAQLAAASKLVELIAIKAPQYASVRAGSVQTEGDTILRSNLLRSRGLTGAGVKVGIISDGSDGLAAAQSSGNLPSNVQRLGNCTPRSEDIQNCSARLTCSEGTAMAEIIHDIAPGAELAIASVSTSLEFIQRLDQLANGFGADIIVDDLGFFGEPFFEDGPIAQAVSRLPEDIIYVSAAGNSGNNHYEQDFSLSTSLTVPDAEFHEFAPNNESLGFIVPARGFTVPILQWSTPFDNPTSDYDLFVQNQTDLVGISTANQSLTGVPAFEAICLPNTSTSDAVHFAFVNRDSGANQRLELFFLGSPAIEFPTPRGSIFGHPGVARAIAVGAINASESGNDQIAFYSSQGPARVDFPRREDRNKPDVIGIDGVRVSGAGGFPSPFFGTSAAAPHVAGIAALLKSVSPRVSADNVRNALEQNAVDLGARGFDLVYGHGRVDALAAREGLDFRFALPPFILLLDDEEN